MSCYELTARRIWEKEFHQEAGDHEFVLADLYQALSFVRLQTLKAGQTVLSKLAK